jgi:ketose-bisphosphate aldolase
VLLVSAAAFARRTGPALVAGCVALAREATVPVAVQLDHAEDIALMRRALDAGTTAVMADGSRLPFADNVALVRAAVDLAAGYGAEVEAELGRLGGHEEVAGSSNAGSVTDPSDVPAFVAACGAHCLAVSVGNVHGDGAAPRGLDWSRLAAIRGLASCPLALHGASGLPPGQLRRAVREGVAKVNVNTELRRRWLHAAAVAVPVATERASMLAVQDPVGVAVRQGVAERLACLSVPAAA